MLNKIKNRLKKELPCLIGDLNRQYSLNKISPLLYQSIREFILRKGKRARPLLFIAGYLGFAKKAAKGLYRSALSLELLHDFMLVHDDIIDKSATRRGKPALHVLLNRYLKKYGRRKFSGEDLSIVLGDVLYAMSLRAFLDIQADPQDKERALKKFISAALYTGSGEFIELLYGLKDIDKIKKEEIYKIYDLKTAHYTFASPLAIGATLAGAAKRETDKLSRYGLYLGRAFQIKDDILGIFSSQRQTGKSDLADLKEAKKTILIWQAYHASGSQDKRIIKNTLAKQKAGKSDLLKIRRIIKKSGALDYAADEIKRFMQKACAILKTSGLSGPYKKILEKYAQEILKL